VKLGALPYRLNEAWNLVGSPERSRSVLGWQAEIPFEEGLRSAWARARKGDAT
jgi:nucleoside-diphosphate-sugar epimerase